MKFVITKKFMVAKIEPKGKVNLYTLLDSENFEKLVVIGSIVDGIKEREIAEAEINIRTYPERFVLQNGETKFVETANMFLVSLKKVKDNA